MPIRFSYIFFLLLSLWLVHVTACCGANFSTCVCWAIAADGVVDDNDACLYRWDCLSKRREKSVTTTTKGKVEEEEEKIGKRNEEEATTRSQISEPGECLHFRTVTYCVSHFRWARLLRLLPLFPTLLPILLIRWRRAAFSLSFFLFARVFVCVQSHLWFSRFSFVRGLEY